MLLEGKNALLEALKSNVTIEKVLILKDVKCDYGSIIKACRERKIPLRFAERSELDRLSPEGGHRGFIGFATDFKYCDVEEIITRKDGKKLLIVILDGIEDPHNLGAVVRVAECAGADGIVIPGRRSCGVTDTVVRVSCGATNHVKIAKVGNVNDFIRDIKERGITVLAADMDGESIYKTDMTDDIAVVIGGEGSGVHALTKKLCDGVVSLPQFGKVNSLNASVAAGIVIYEGIRQRCASDGK